MSAETTGSGERMGEPKITITASTELSPGLTHVTYSFVQARKGTAVAMSVRFTGTAIVGALGAAILSISEVPDGLTVDDLAALVFQAVAERRAEMCPPAAADLPVAGGRMFKSGRTRLCEELGLIPTASTEAMVDSVRALKAEISEAKDALAPWCAEADPGRTSLGSIVSMLVTEVLEPIEEGLRRASELPDRPGWWWCKIFGRWEPRFVHDPTGDGLEVYCAGPVSAYPEWGDRIPMPDDGEGEP